MTLSGGTSQATDYSYGAQGWLSSFKDVSTGEQWTDSYNALGQVVSQTTPNGGTTSSTYDADGNVASTTDAGGTAIVAADVCTPAKAPAVVEAFLYQIAHPAG